MKVRISPHASNHIEAYSSGTCRKNARKLVELFLRQEIFVGMQVGSLPWISYSS